MPLSAGARLGPHEILAALGAGGMGEVYLAEDTHLGRRVALKVLPAAVVSSPGRRARLEREAHAAAALNHPNICTIFDLGEAAGQPYIAMEYCEGSTLRAWGSQKTVTDIIGVALQMADALDEAHRRRILHRDLKTDNVLVTPRGQVKILDFGLAKELPADDGLDPATVTRVTEAGTVMGTPAYMSPEQALGRTLDTRSDLFSFGVVLYQLLTDRLPFDGPTWTEQVDAVLHRDPPPIQRYNDQVPDSLARLVRRMLEKEPDRRVQTAREVWNGLRDVREELTGERLKTPAGA